VGDRGRFSHATAGRGWVSEVVPLIVLVVLVIGCENGSLKLRLRGK
jgi:hypothetical protein